MVAFQFRISIKPSTSESRGLVNWIVKLYFQLAIVELSTKILQYRTKQKSAINRLLYICLEMFMNAPYTHMYLCVLQSSLGLH